MLAIGSVVDGKYKILNEIGHGGMSVVYLAINERANKTWAIKEVRKDGSSNAQIVTQGLIAETEMLKKLSHPHLPSIIDVIDGKDTFLIVMDYIEGRSLQDLLGRGGAQSPDKVVEWARQLCDVLSYLHSRRPPIIYRDMKPANVMLKPDGNVTLIDFGTAREYKAASTGDTTCLGTRGYAAPEQFGGRGQTDARTDIYCLGATMYHLLTGRSPADTQFVILPLGQLNPALAGSGIEKIVAKCCAPDPIDRYQSAAELMYALEHVHDEDDVARRRRSRIWNGFVACLVAAAVGAAGMIGFRAAASRARQTGYDYYVTQAKNAGGAENAAELYRKAIDLRPADADAYEALIGDFDSDMVLTQDESRALLACVMDTDGGTKTNLDYLMNGNRKGYDEFVYHLANDYYFFFEGSDNRTKAASWYGKILESKYLSAQELQLARSLNAIGNYYSSLGSSKNIYAVGSDSSSYLTFWNQLVDLTDGDVVAKTGGTRYAVSLYKELAAQIFTNTANFRSFGVAKDDMEAQLLKLRTGLVTLVPENAVIQKQIADTQALVETCENQVAAVYGS